MFPWLMHPMQVHCWKLQMTDNVSFQFYHARTRPAIGLTPLIDVVFILLLFFMLASNFNAETSLSVQSAGKKTTSFASAQPPSSLRLLNTDSFSLNGDVLDSVALNEALTELYARDASHSLSISVAEGTRVQALLDLIALAEKIGLTRVTMESLLP